MDTLLSPQYKIRLPLFEGPLDLLLFFIKRDELDIYNIPIHHITTEFLGYIKLMQALDLEVAGEFIVVAAELCQIKAKMLLPRDERPAGEVEEDDPRAELIRRLLEYRRFKEMSEKLYSMSEEARKLFYRKYFDADENTYVDPDVEENALKNVTLFHLLNAYKKAMERAPLIKRTHDVEMIPVTVEEQCEFILDSLSMKGEMSFIELFTGFISSEPLEELPTSVRLRIVVSFIAVLELVKSNMIALRQHESFDDIILFKP
jgi:segregation and condensation protein A